MEPLELDTMTKFGDKQDVSAAVGAAGCVCVCVCVSVRLGER